MAVWRGYCGAGGKPAGNRENKYDPNQLEKPVYSTHCQERLCIADIDRELMHHCTSRAGGAFGLHLLIP